MKYNDNYLLKLLNDHGVPKTLEMIDIEKIETETIKIIARTIVYSQQKLMDELISRTAKPE